MTVLLSIKPEYVKKIFSGAKKFEFRTQKPNNPPSLVHIYESFPTKLIVGWFKVKKILSGSPEDIWNKCHEYGGIEKEKFFEYCKGSEIVYAFEIEKCFKFPNPIDPYVIDPKFKPPQNFSYRNYPISYEGFKEQTHLDGTQ
jgi:predicted transcriptional regulator